MNIFFYGGTFDPPHLGHEMIIKQLLPSCDKFIVFPSKKSPLKNSKPIANGIQRIDMLALLFDDSKIEIDDYEIKSVNKSYTYLTIEYLKKKYEKSSFTMVVGKDQLKTLQKWKLFDTFVDDINIICFNRNAQEELCVERFNDYKNIKFVDDFEYNISSTEIRKSLYHLNYKDSISMLDSRVLKYIKKNNLYA